ncbi:WXG100 family type VII secretion target [Kitasatospora sp. NPDC054939]
MADIRLNHAAIEAAADSLVQASNGLSEAVTKCAGEVKSAQNELQGDLKAAASDFHNRLTSLNGTMSDQLREAANTLRRMREMLAEADARAGRGMG